MTRRSAAVAAVWAMGSFSLALAGFWPGALRAVDGPRAATLQVERPALAASGCNLSVQLDERRQEELDAGRLAYAPGEKATFRLVAMNTTGEAQSIQCELELMSVQPASPLARMMPTPESIWKKTLNIALSPNESRTIAVEPDLPLPAGNITLRASAGERPVVLLSFATMTAETALRNSLRGSNAPARLQALEVQR